MMELTVAGVQTDSASASQKGDITNHQPINEALGSLITGNGSWTLALNNLVTTDKKVAGTATVTLNSTHPAFNFNVNGLFKPRLDTATLTLTAADAATKGSSLVVSMSGTNTVTAIRGSISGQSVKVIF